ncbi:unnamed protein product [Clonostachys rosea]|uniref:Uncharacterized protein n=1 Tax=Bionectria ochroleuca TaxID=29856 RepID=A0ABY6V1I0_BIOOC|nr:unnamed protein product [Clonostachys rosea]
MSGSHRVDETDSLFAYPSVDEWMEATEAGINYWAGQIQGGGCAEACDQIAQLSDRIIRLESTPMTEDQKKGWKREFAWKFEFLEKLCKDHLKDLPHANRKDWKKELWKVKEEYKNAIRFLR